MQEHFLQLLKWLQSLLTRAIVALEGREEVSFSLLFRRGVSFEEMSDHLRNLGICLSEKSPHSDYVKGTASVKDFSELFGADLRWRSMLVGSWEILGDTAAIPDEISKLGAKEIRLYRNILLPYGFIKNSTIP
jgi:hypothetical protein